MQTTTLILACLVTKADAKTKPILKSAKAKTDTESSTKAVAETVTIAPYYLYSISSE